MSNVPLTVYEFLVYIGTGAILLAVVSIAWAYPWIPAGPVSIPLGLLWIIAAYVTGHVVAHVSGYLLEDQIVRRWLDPVDAPALLQDQASAQLKRYFSSFCRPLPAATKGRVIAEAERHGAAIAGRPLFLHCFAVVKHDAAAFGRMNAFINQYGFCRNMSLISLIAAILFLTRPLVTKAVLAPQYTGVTALAIIGSLLMAVLMFYRYLKFYRLYSHEVFITYAENSTSTPPITP